MCPFLITPGRCFPALLPVHITHGLCGRLPPTCVVAVRSLVVLGLHEVPEDVVVAPAWVAHRLPVVEVSPVAADVDHRVNGGGAACGTPPRIRYCLRINLVCNDTTEYIVCLLHNMSLKKYLHRFIYLFSK